MDNCYVKHLKVTKNITNLPKKFCEFPPCFPFLAFEGSIFSPKALCLICPMVNPASDLKRMKCKIWKEIYLRCFSGEN